MSWGMLLPILILALCFGVDGKALSKDELADRLHDIENSVEQLSDTLKGLSDDPDLLTDLDNLDGPLESPEEKDEYGEIATIAKRGEDDRASIDDINKINEGVDVADSLYQVDIREEDNETQEDGIEKRSALRDNELIWKDRTVPYAIHSSIVDYKTKVILGAMRRLENVSCIKFREKNASDENYVLFVNSSGCWSYVGFKKNMKPQYLSIGDGCQYTGIVLHEMLHMLGFYHEQSRYDRDQFVQVLYENIITNRENNFKKRTRTETRNLNSKYDYNSLMHYGGHSFSKNGDPTIVATKPGVTKLGQRDDFSEEDKIGLNRLYHCENTDNLGNTVWTKWSDYGACYLPAGGPCFKSRYRYCGGGTCKCDEIKDENGTVLERPCEKQDKNCTDLECRLHGHWGHWDRWSSCSATTRCRSGTKTTSRICNNPPPRKGGSYCNGTDSKIEVCSSICPRKCTFNDNGCGYVLTGRWRIISGSTPSRGTGPTADVDGGDGSYAYTEVSSLPGSNLKYNMESVEFLANGVPQCFSMFYHMNGRDVGKLEVFVSTNATNPKLLWDISGSQGDQWHSVEFNVDEDKPFKIRLVTTTLKSWKGDIAVDNLFLSYAPCASTNITTTGSPSTRSTSTRNKASGGSTKPPTVSATSGKPPKPATTKRPTVSATSGKPPKPATTKVVPGTINELLGFASSFDNGDMGGMTVASPYPTPHSQRHSMSQWQAVDSIHSRKPIPLQDRVVEGGYFLAVYCQRRTDRGKASTVMSEEFTSTGPVSIEFYYYMYDIKTSLGYKHNHRMGLLQMSVTEDGSYPVIKFLKTGAANGEWNYARLSLDIPKGTKFHLLFTAILGRVGSAIAIDDIRGIKDSQKLEAKVKNYYRDITARIFSPTALSCSFSNKAKGSCLWHLSKDFRWTPHNGTTATDDTGPAFGAVTGRSEDHYIYAEASAPRSEGDRAEMESPVIYSSKPMCMIFYTSTYGEDIGSLNVTVAKMAKRGSVVSVSKDFTHRSYFGSWVVNALPLPVDEPFKVTIEAKVGKGPAGDIAMDNILAIPGTCPIFKSKLKSVCDFSDEKLCKKNGINGYRNFKIAKEPGTTAAYYYKAHGHYGKARLTITVKGVSQAGGCLNFQYRVHTPTNYAARIYMDMYAHTGRIHKYMLHKDFTAACEGDTWQYFEGSIPPRSTKEDVEITFSARFGNGEGHIHEIDIDDISVAHLMCYDPKMESQWVKDARPVKRDVMSF